MDEPDRPSASGLDTPGAHEPGGSLPCNLNQRGAHRAGGCAFPGQK
ncbi:MAG: hypothetical protein QOE54_726 [Streptosporangiaceae bacterium]|jgi:hypothetical protein|nr:hypothetical protein [Streptosporangiaceae bacterium]MDX6428360.1 hypothetical protein [Streptosporangiaceae bacterium]